jgi:hypothetical protein
VWARPAQLPGPVGQAKCQICILTEQYQQHFSLGNEVDYFIPANPNCMCRVHFCKGCDVRRRNLAR